MGYSNGCEHSRYLNEIFSISKNGVDYYNPYNLGFEFKESFMSKKEDIFFKVPEKQADCSDFFVFCVHTTEYYLIQKDFILDRFNFETKEKNANIRINTIRKNAEFLTFDVFEMKDHIDNMRRV